MKWFKHMSDSRFNLKLRPVIAKFGMEGYGVYWSCVEMVAQQGCDSRIKGEKEWRNALLMDTRVAEKKLDDILEFFASSKLIDEKALKNKDLFIPKMRDYSDEYTDKVRRKSRQGRDNVVLEEKRTDKNRTEEKRVHPQEISQRFFSDPSKQEEVILGLVSSGAPDPVARQEISKFVGYWTELNKSGTKQRWELEKTFEVQRRLSTWLRNVNQFQNKNVGRELKIISY